MLILDTDHVSLLEWAKGDDYRRLKERLAKVADRPIVTPNVTYEEHIRGWMAYLARARSVGQQIEAYRRLERQLNLYRAIEVIGFDQKSAGEFQRLKAGRIRVGTMDLRIAAIALANDATLLSRNLADFARVPGLTVLDWSAD